MNHQKILERAISLAIDGGWTFNDWLDANDFEWRVGLDEFEELTVYTESSLGDFEWHPWIIIFNHDFAKALWGEEPEYAYKEFGDNKTINRIEAGKFIPWQHHLAMMVIAEDPVEYLGAHLP